MSRATPSRESAELVVVGIMDEYDAFIDILDTVLKTTLTGVRGGRALETEVKKLKEDRLGSARAVVRQEVANTVRQRSAVSKDPNDWREYGEEAMVKAVEDDLVAIAESIYEGLLRLKVDPDYFIGRLQRFRNPLVTAFLGAWQQAASAHKVAEEVKAAVKPAAPKAPARGRGFTEYGFPCVIPPPEEQWGEWVEVVREYAARGTLPDCLWPFVVWASFPWFTMADVGYPSGYLLWAGVALSPDVKLKLGRFSRFTTLRYWYGQYLMPDYLRFYGPAVWLPGLNTDFRTLDEVSCSKFKEALNQLISGFGRTIQIVCTRLSERREVDYFNCMEHFKTYVEDVHDKLSKVVMAAEAEGKLCDIDAITTILSTDPMPDLLGYCFGCDYTRVYYTPLTALLQPQEIMFLRGLLIMGKVWLLSGRDTHAFAKNLLRLYPCDSFDVPINDRTIKFEVPGGQCTFAVLKELVQEMPWWKKQPSV